MIPGSAEARRAPLLAAAFLALLAAIWAGLIRIGWPLPFMGERLAMEHGPLMVAGFLGTLISLERAVALDARWAYAAPVPAALGTLLVLLVPAGGAAGPLLITAGSAALLADFAVIVRRQPALFTVTMGMGAIAWLVGDAMWLAGVPIFALVRWWAAFLVLTIMGERVELSRMRGPSRLDAVSFAGAAAVYVAGLVCGALGVGAGAPLTGLGLIGFALWIAHYDVARRTIGIAGLPRYVALNLLGGAGWLAVAGALWMRPGALAAGSFAYDAALHSLFLGFVFSIIFAHAPLILPAVIGAPLRFRRWFYIHVAALHVSLMVRIGADLASSFAMRKAGGLLGATALLMFIAATALAVARGDHTAGEAHSMPEGALDQSSLG
jgi:hypothetical protein